jgi:hypothetical protein
MDREVILNVITSNELKDKNWTYDFCPFSVGRKCRNLAPTTYNLSFLADKWH